MINQRVHFEQIASVLNVPKEQIKMMNPQYRREIIPGDLKPYAVVLPVKMTGMFIDKFDEIVAYKADSLVNTRRTEVTIPKGTASAGGKVIYHTVRKGQTLSGIAARYGVSISRIRQWNNLRGSMIRPGQRLKINK
jgi:membrane-bound lytic murein transglycosylase D